MAAYTYTSKFLNLLPYVLMEYQYTVSPDTEEYPVNFGLTTVGYEKIVNGYNGTNQILNKIQDTVTTGNSRNKSVVQIADNTFVNLTQDYLLQYLDYDNNLTDVNNLAITFPSNIEVLYDTIRFHYLSGYNFPDTDGNIFQVQFLEKSGKKTTVAQILTAKNDQESVIFNSNPIYYNGGVFDKYVEVKIPAYSDMSYAYETLSGSPSQAETLAALISSDNNGYILGNPFNITAYEIIQSQKVSGYDTYITQYSNSAVLTPSDEYGNLSAILNENEDNNYWEYYPTWNNEFIDQFIYTENSLGNLYYVINNITISEQVGMRLIKTSQFQTIQTSDFDQPQIFRPIVTNAKATSFNIDYTFSLVNKVTNTSIVRNASVTSFSTDLYGYGLNKIQLRNDPYPLKVYNKVVESSKITSAYNINVNPINNIITKYVPAFFEMENISITSEDLTVKNTGNRDQTVGVDPITALGQGKLRIVVNPFDNYFKFRIFNTNSGKENTVIDLGTNSSYRLVFNGDNNKQIKIESLTDNTFQNPTKGEIAFKVIEADSKTIQAFKNRDFHITSVSPNGIETSLYYGKWILPSERDTKAPVVTTPKVEVTAAPRAEGKIINSIKSISNDNVTLNTAKSVFDVKLDNVLGNIAPISRTNTVTTGLGGNLNPINKPANIDLVSLSNSISGDAALGKTYKDIADYYTIPGRPGSNTYPGLTKEKFLEAVRKVYPDANGTYSKPYLEYATYLGIKPSQGTSTGKQNRFQ